MPPSPTDDPGRETLRIIGFNPANDEDSWKNLFEALASLGKWDRQTLKGGLAGKVGTAIIEGRYICKDHRSLYSNFFSKKFAPADPYCQRVHFFSESLPLESGDPHQVLTALAKKEFAKTYIGFSVIRPEGIRVLGRTILDPNKFGKGIADGKYCLTAKFKVHLAGTSLVARGYPYISQDTESMVCAHAAIWGACRFLSQQYRTYKEVYPYDIVRYANPQGGRSIPYRGMSYNDYSDIFTRFGCHPILRGNTTIARGGEGFHDLYAYVESGIPVLASNTRHVIALIGHTLDLTEKASFTKRPDGTINCSDFVNALIVVDDNHFPYREVGWAGSEVAADVTKRGDDKNIYIGDLKHYVVPLPEKVYLTADRARSFFSQTLGKSASPKFDAILDPARKEGLVVRQFITTGSAMQREALHRYQDTRSEVYGRIVEMHMPHFVWVMELATLSGYRSHTCLGEIVIDATGSHASRNLLLFMRVGDHALFTGETKIFSAKQATKNPKQFSHNLGHTNTIHE